MFVQETLQDDLTSKCTSCGGREARSEQAYTEGDGSKRSQRRDKRHIGCLQIEFSRVDTVEEDGSSYDQHGSVDEEGYIECGQRIYLCQSQDLAPFL